MTEHITVKLDGAELARARSAAEAQGIALEDYLHKLITANLPSAGAGAAKDDVSSIFGIVQDGEPTDIARDKDRLIGEAVWQEYLEETRQK